MTQKAIAFVGISGVGKTTFLKNLAHEVTFQHLTAGTLISSGRSLEQQDRDQLRLSNVDENQMLLITGFHHARDHKTPFIVMDGHVVIHTETSLDIISSDVFKALKIDAMMHLVADPKHILENRLKDTCRKRPVLSEQHLDEHQNSSLLASQKISETLDIPWIEVTANKIDIAKCFFLEL